MTLHDKIRSIWRRFRREGPKSPDHPDLWGAFLRTEAGAWSEAQRRARSGPRVLMATSVGGYQRGASIESLLAVALTLRGASVDILLCDRQLPACQMSEFTLAAPEQLLKESEQPFCDSCQPAGQVLYEPLGLPLFSYGQFLAEEDRESARRMAEEVRADRISSFQWEGLAVGEHAMAGALRYFARGDIRDEPYGEAMARRYLEASLRTVMVFRKLLEKNSYDVAVFNHGLYIPFGAAGEVCRRKKVRVVNWCPAYRKQCFIFSHGDTYHHTLLSEPPSEWERVSMTPTLEARTMEYLRSRWEGTQDWISFHKNPILDDGRIARMIGIDPSRPCIGMLTSVMWDAQLHYRSNAFPNMREWVMQTISYFSKRPELQLIIRVHPAEITGWIPSRQKIADEIRRAFPSLPSNVILIPPDSPVSTYALMKRCNAVIIYNTKAGIEVSSMGIPVIVAGEAWIRGKGFSQDASSPDQYRQLLDRLPYAQSLRAGDLERARKYAFHFFFRRMIPLPMVSVGEGSRFSFALTGLKDLEPGRSSGLDVICDGILHGKPFVYPAESRL